jgi:hypothetical protein
MYIYLTLEPVHIIIFSAFTYNEISAYTYI